MQFLEHFNKAFESKARLGIMSALAVSERRTFNELKEILNLTDGNLSTHLKSLEDLAFILSEKTFVGRKPTSFYSITDTGSQAFEQHLAALTSFLKMNE